jgi:hypothetical protein
LFVSADLKVSIHQATEAKKLLDFHLLRLEVEMAQKTYDMTVILRIGGISLVHFDPVASVCLLDTPMAAGDSKYLFTVLYVDVSSNSSMVVDSKLKCFATVQIYSGTKMLYLSTETAMSMKEKLALKIL